MMARILLFILMVCAAPLRAGVMVQEVTSPGGINAWLVEDHTLPFLALELTFAGGTALDPEGAEGAGYLMSGLLEEGAGARDATAFQTARESLATEFGFDITDDYTTVTALILTQNRDEAVALLSEALTAPRFDDKAVERVRAQVLSGLAADARNPSNLAGRDFAATVFAGHPYARPREGTPESVAALTVEDLRAAHKRLLTRGGVQASVVGDVTAKDLGLMLDDLLGDLPGDAPALPGAADPQLDGASHLTDFPTPQSVVVFVQPGLPQDHPDFIPAYILNQILGGSGMQSRLMEEVREKRGLTYGIYSYLTDRTGAALWQGAFASGNGTVGEAIGLVRAEWARIARDGVTAEELTAAKTYLTGAYPLRFDGNGRVAGILSGMQVQGLEPGYIAERNTLIEAVTLEEINRVAADLLDPEALTFFVAGQPEPLPAR